MKLNMEELENFLVSSVEELSGDIFYRATGFEEDHPIYTEWYNSTEYTRGFHTMLATIKYLIFLEELDDEGLKKHLEELKAKE